MQSRQSLELRQHQQLALTPQLQQSIRFLQLSTHELEQEVAQALQDNPLLEREEEYDTIDGVAVVDDVQALEERWTMLGLSNRASGNNADDESQRPETALAETLQGYLQEQLRLTRAQPRDCALVTLLIEELDENGYLPTGLEEILTFLPPELDVELDELHAALRLLQSFDPPGVAARSLAECLCLQLNHLQMLPAAAALPGDVLALARRIAADHLTLLATGNLARVRDALDCDHELLLSAHALLLQLEPKPAKDWATSTADYITPDVLLRKVRNTWVVTINPAIMPRLRINSVYESLLSAAPPAPAMQSQLQQAHGLIKSMNQRFVTIQRVMQAIVNRQKDFFEQGPAGLRPLQLRDIAQELDLHESTISRATKQKYAQTPWGVIELKSFFSTALQTDDGQSTTASAVQVLIQKLVGEESGKKPLSDSQIAARLTDQGIVIARRTVAKYREAAGIEPAIIRKARAALVAR
ncbi:RNA polymerase factor sigma-54 [Pollutimonas harenae]|uniref:RNA polymerase sigma-54 factor n=1 Tax=Pollutimonas harenae TaxID=657015 RepID=A0A853GWG3_9BURK|nr:RNA polymerase factor sigma-54 [Pollutimonas harenae]NYT84472.1 RNA polymerase factor sigma-54 [Pollutimonas harenae]TEA73130.1 RNA polymerase factor sigma-54 [Pollutimonas harenae]